MADEVIQLKATFVSDEALRDLQAFGRVSGFLPRRAGQDIKATNAEMQTLTATVKNLGRELASSSSLISGLARGGGIVGVVAVIIETARRIAMAVPEISKTLTNLQHTARELGMTTAE